MGSQVSSMKDELGKKIDEAKLRLQDNSNNNNTDTNGLGDNSNNNNNKKNNNKKNNNHNNNNNNNIDETNERRSILPKINIYGSNSSTDLLDEAVIDKSLRGDINISHDTSYENIENIDNNSSNKSNNNNSNSSNSNNSESNSDNNKRNINNSNSNETNSNNNNIDKNNIDNNNNNDNNDKIDENEMSSSSTTTKTPNGDVKKKLKKMKKEVICTDDICFTIDPQVRDVAEYCVPLLHVHFCGQTNITSRSDQSDTKDVLNLGLYLKLVDKFLHQFDNVTEFNGEEEEYRRLLKLVSFKRKQKDESTNDCFQRILGDSNRFVRIYHKRGVASQRLQHRKYWGSRQQLLAGKVISDWIDPEGGPMDPIFGVILQPTAGRAGPGDSGWMHSILFDDVGHMAYHSAVHDAFGYLLVTHGQGPGYNYLNNSHIDKLNPLSGQLSGVSFWKEVIGEVAKKQIVLTRVDL